MIGNPEVMQLATKYGLPRTTLMQFMLKLMANLTDPRGGDAIGPRHQRPVEDGARRMTAGAPERAAHRIGADCTTSAPRSASE